MSKIIKFKNENNNLVEYLEELIEVVKEHKLDNILIASIDKLDNKVVIGHCNLDLYERQNLIGHLQVENILDVIDETYL